MPDKRPDPVSTQSVSPHPHTPSASSCKPVCVCVYVLAQSCPALCHPRSHQAPLSMESSRQEYWSRLPFPPPGHLPNPDIELGSPALQADSLPSEQAPDSFLEDCLGATGAVLPKWPDFWKSLRVCAPRRAALTRLPGGAGTEQAWHPCFRQGH